MTHAAIYVRISADKDGRALGVARQEADCRALAARLGWTVAEVFQDNDASAFSGKPRPAYQRLLAAMRAGTITAVLAYAPDRLYRRLADLAEFIDVVAATQCAVQTVAAGEIDLSTASGRQTAKLLGVIAEGESDRIGERIRRKLAENQAAGLPHGGRRPYGWETDRMTVREDEARWIRWGVKQTLARVPLRAQYRELNERGVLSSVGREWRHVTWRGVLTTARHAGLMRDGQSAAAWPQIITPEEHRAVVRILSDPARVTTPGRGGRLHLLSGIARCALCDGPMRVTKSRSRGAETYDVYSCKDKTGEVQRSKEHLDRIVRESIAGMLREKGAGLLDGSPDETEAAQARQAAETEAARLRLLIDEAAAEHGQLGLPLSALAAYTAPLREQLAAAEAAAAPPRDRKTALGDLFDQGDPGAAFLALSTDRQRPIVDLLLDIRIGKGRRGNTFRADGIDIDWR